MMKKILNVVVKLIIIALFFVIIFAAFKLAPNYMKSDLDGKTNLIINYTNVTNKMKQELIIDEKGVIYLSMNDIMNYYDKHIYYDEQYKQIVTASENKLAILKLNDKNVEINGAKKAIKGAVFQKDGIYYIPISEIEEVYNLKISKIEERIVLESLDKKLIVANVNKKTNLKYKPTVLSRTIEKIDSNEKISIAEVGENTIPTGWIKVRTQNGNIGYIQEKNITEKKVERQEKIYFEKPEEKISLVWEYFSEYAKAPDNTNIKYDGVNVVSPSFFYMKLNNTEKEQLSKQDVIEQAKILENMGEEGINYIKWAKYNGYEVWPKVSNDTLSTTIDEFSIIINDYELRSMLIEDIKRYAKQYDLDGINLDFEFMYKKDKDAFSKFVIELAPQLREMGVCLSVDVTAPDGSDNWSLCYDRNVLGEVADYIVFMGYDQYGTNTIGTTAGYSWVKNSVNKFLKQAEVPAEKLILALPFYTKIWKTKGDVVVGSNAIGMNNVNAQIPNNVEKQWKEDLQQYYIQYDMAGYTYKMWIEDEKSFIKKLDLVNENNLAGAAYWRKGFEEQSIWKIIKQKLEI